MSLLSMCKRCNHCGLPVDLELEPQANKRDMVFIICDLCHTLPKEILEQLPDAHTDQQSLKQ